MTRTRAEPAPLDRTAVRAEFPIFDQEIHGKPLVYLDSAATTQKPRSVLDAVRDHDATSCSNVHRGVHLLSQRATAQYEGVRAKVRGFINAADEREVVFVRGTTEAINLVANAFAASRVGRDDRILLTGMEHHANIVPWQLLAERVGATIDVTPLDDRGELDLDDLERRIGPRTRMLAVSHVSNALGTVNPVERIVEIARSHGVPVLIDGAQAIGHEVVDVSAIGCDFYAFSAHKMYGPSGIGALWGRLEHLESMPPWQGGGDMIESVTFEKTTFNAVPHKFEAGTPNIAGTVGMGAAIDFVEALGRDRIGASERELLDLAVDRLRGIPGLRFIGTPRHRAAVVSFTLDGIHPHDVGTVLDAEGIAVRAGHHCAQPVMERYGLPATVRASFGVYNTPEDVEALVRGIERVREVFA